MELLRYSKARAAAKLLNMHVFNIHELRSRVTLPLRWLIKVNFLSVCLQFHTNLHRILTVTV